MNRVYLNNQPPYYDEEEWRIIGEAFNHYANNVSEIAAMMRSLPDFDSIKKYRGSMRIKLADMRYLYQEALDVLAMQAAKGAPILKNALK